MADFIYGINPVREGLRGGRRKPLVLMLAEASQSPRHQELLAEATRAGVSVLWKKRQELDRLAGSSRHQGALLEIASFVYATLEELLADWKNSGQKAFFLVLDGITDPHNLGAILRSADAAGCQGVIMAKDRSCPVTAVVDKVSAGALEHVALCQVTNLSRTLEKLQGEGVWVFGLAGEEGATPLFNADLAGDVALVVGSEGAGLRPNVRRHCDMLLAIPMAGKVSSLNASVAAALALFEVVRQRGGFKV